MNKSHPFIIYVGHFRLYSLVDLAFLLVAISAPKHLFAGYILLWIAFLFFLNERHRPEYRFHYNREFWVVLTGAGLIILHHWAGLLFVLFSFVYTLKKQGRFALISPIIHGLQAATIVGSVLGFHHYFTWIAAGALAIRNLAGDVRDIKKDRERGIFSIPIAFGLQNGNKYIHLAAILVTTLIWAIFGHIQIEFLIMAWLVEIMSYNLTQR